MDIESEKAGAPQGLGRLQDYFTRDKLLRAAAFCAKQLGAAALGCLLARADFAGGVFAPAAPFAVAFGAAAGARYLGMGVLGAAFGCIAFIPHPASVSAMAMAAAAGLFNLAFRRFGARQDVAAPLCAFGCSAASAMAALLAAPPEDAMAWMFALCGAVLAGCCAYFILLLQGGIGTGGQLRLGHRERAALLLCCGMALTCLGGFAWGAFRPAQGIAVLFVLAAAWCWREAGGAIAGACAGAALTLAGAEPALGAVYALGGLLAGVFSHVYNEASFAGETGSSGGSPDRAAAKTQRGAAALQTVPMAGGFALACVFYVAIHGHTDRDPAAAVVFALESICAMLVFACVPLRWWNRLRAALASPAGTAPRGPEGEAAMQLSRTASALRKVGEYVTEVSQGLEHLQSGLPEQSVCARARDTVCARCPEDGYCHMDHAYGTADFFTRSTKILRKDGEFSLERLAQTRRDCGLGLPCRAPEALREAMLRAYDVYAAQQTCGQAESGLRRAAAAQFGAISGLMDEVGAQLARRRDVEEQAAGAARRVLSDHGFSCHAVSCVRDSTTDNAAVLTAAVKPEDDRSSLESLTRAISRATGIRFAPPEASPIEDGALLTFAQQPLYSLQTGAVQMSSSRSEYCGDYFDCFGDGRGREVLVISDGMGTGGRAAVDSALATEIFSVLTRSGISFAGAVGVANQALLLKSCEETLATIDAAGVNLYTGEAEFCKAGGAASYLRRRGRAERVELGALPAGILREIHPAQHRAVLEHGDILVLVSDGVLCGQEDWLCDEIEPWQGTMQALAEHIAALAVRRRETSEREDDLTVVCARLDNA
ncbi:MAG: serine/threonine-protein phosphatase [Oscillospiraceae bacterium]|nr:serine/threonine-protein phosphatase [Oscillospiraceae bacterium]